MKTSSAIFATFIGLLLALTQEQPVLAQQAQVINPLYLQAKDILNTMLDAPRISPSLKSSFRSRFADLDAEQKSLWFAAGQVDSGQCNNSCIDLYNRRIEIWENNLQQFIAEGNRWLKTFQAPTLRECLSDCDTSFGSCRPRCNTVAPEENLTCVRDCFDQKDRCVAKCSGPQ